MRTHHTFFIKAFLTNIVDGSFRHNRKDEQFDNWFKRLMLVIQQSGIIAVESIASSRVSLQAAAMTYYTLFMAVPFFALALVFSSDNVNLTESLTTIFGYILPKHSDTINDLFGSADTMLSGLKTGFKGMTGVIIVMIVIYMWGFLVNLQHLINQSWNCEDRPFCGKLKFGLFIVVGALITSLLWAFSLKLAGHYVFWRVTFTVVILSLAMFAVFNYLPNNRKVGVLPSLFGSLVLSFFLTGTWSLLMRIPSKADSYGSYAPLFFAVLVAYCSWYEFFIAAKLCSHWDKSDDKYLNKEVKELAPFMEDYLSVHVMSFIVRSFKHFHEGVTIDEIRRGMLRSKVITGQEDIDLKEWKKVILHDPTHFWKFRHIYKKTVSESELYAIKVKNEFGQDEYVIRPSIDEIMSVIKSLRKLGQMYLPNSLLSQILRKLENRMLVDVHVVHEGGKMIKTYLPKGTSKAGNQKVIPVDIDSITVGELLWKLKFDGEYDLKYNYLALDSIFAQGMYTAYFDCYRSLDMKLSEMYVDMDMRQNDTSYTKKTMYDMYQSRMTIPGQIENANSDQTVDMGEYLQSFQEQFGGLSDQDIENLLNELPADDEMRIQFEMMRNMSSRNGERTGIITS